MTNQRFGLAEKQQQRVLSPQRAVHKFGGSSLADANAYRRVLDIVLSHASLDDVVVVSAAGTTTNQLIRVLDNLSAQPAIAAQQLGDLQQYQLGLACELLVPQQARLFTQSVESDLSHFYHQGQLHIAERERNDWLALGELWSARLLAACLNQCRLPSVAVDARQFLQLAQRGVNYTASSASWNRIQQPGRLHVVTGFIATDEQGKHCTLGRNGSDYTATIVARIIAAAEATIWTDVDGIYDADPRQIQRASKISHIHWAQAQTLAQLGNPVLHHNTLKPLQSQKCRLYVRSSINADNPATQICHQGSIDKAVTAVTQTNHVNIIRLSKTDYKTLSPALPELWCLADIHFEADQLVAVHEESTDALNLALATYQIEPLEHYNGTLLAFIGDGEFVHHRYDHTVRQVLADNDIVAIDNSRQQAAVFLLKNTIGPSESHELHSRLFSKRRRIGVLVAGCGNIGHTFLQQFVAQQRRLAQIADVQLIGVFNSKVGMFAEYGLDAQQVLSEFAQQAKPYQWPTLVANSKHWHCDEVVVIDITSSQAFSDYYTEFFAAGIHLITANKHANSARLPVFGALKQKQAESKVAWLFNTSVGAGLPVNASIEELRNSGDEIQAISGIFSGTLSWLFEHYDGSEPFSVLLKQALSLGITEPDPREDLSGRDVHRKLLILARLAGETLCQDDIALTSLVPEHLQDISKQAFLDDLSALDALIHQAWQDARDNQKVLRYVAEYRRQDQGFVAHVGLQEFDKTHPFANLTPGDNIFVIESAWYHSNPLIIRGPGAGRDVTAGGLHSDLFKLVTELSHSNQQPSNVVGIEKNKEHQHEL